MAIILDKYAIKEVADVMFYELDSKGAPSAPVLYLDTLKTSTLSQSSEVVDARGGKGNVKLLSWDTNKELTLEMEDAVFSAKSLAIMFGGNVKQNGANQEVLKSVKGSEISVYKNDQGTATDYLVFTLNGNSYYIHKDLVTVFSYATADGVEQKDPVPIPKASVDWANWQGAVAGQKIEFITFDLLDCVKSPTSNGGQAIEDGLTIDITAEFGSNTYYITGDTYARNVASGKDEFLQFIIPKGKVSAEDVSLTMEADGDPATFSMNIQCLKSESGSMVKLVKYNMGTASGTTGKNKGVASVLDDFNAEGERAEYDTPRSVITAGSKTEETIIPN